MANNTLIQAKAAKADEFYTRLEDIEAELYHYQNQFRNKTVICNCDDPRVSNFNVYFKMAFETLGLKRLICTCYKNTNIDLFHSEVEEQEKAVYSDYNGIEEMIIPLKGNGDFRSKECLALLDDADIVVTNPPFSLFREFIATIIKHNKQFLIIGNQNAISYKDVFQFFKENKTWLGYKAGDMAFRVPEDYGPRDTRYWIDESGQHWRSLGNACWYTNLDIKKRHDFLDIWKTYSPEKYPKYDEYDAININCYTDIPYDYDGYMGVPITFLSYFCPEQFEIKGIDRYIEDNPNFGHRFKINGKEVYARIIIRNLHPGEEF